MLNRNSRPVWVWAILIWFMIVGIASLYELITLFEGLGGISELPVDIDYYIIVLVFSLITLSASAMLFLRYAANRWLFMFVLILNVINATYLIFDESVPNEYMHSTISLSLINTGLFALIAFYTFRLMSDGYYVEFRSKKRH